MTRLFPRLAIALTLLLAGTAAQAEDSLLLERFQAGTHYAELQVPVAPVDPDGGIEVVEVFSYECPHCYNLESTITSWLANKPADVDFVRVPAVFNKRYELYARAFYALAALDKLDELHGTFFHARHDLGLSMANEDELAELFAGKGVDPVAFTKAMKSFGVRSAVQQATARARAYRLTAVPTLIVAGKYRVDGRMAGSNAAMLDVVDHLVAKERQSVASGG